MRRLLLVIAVVVASLALLAAAMPWWLGGAMSAAGGRLGLTFGRYERVGYARFRLTDVRVDRGTGWVASARTVDAPAVLPWALSLLGGERKRAQVADWAVVVTPRPRAPRPPRPLGWRELQRRLRERVAPVLRALPEVEGTQGIVRWPGHAIRFERVTWRNDRLRVVGQWDELPPAVVEAWYVDGGTLQVSASAESAELQGEFQAGASAVKGKIGVFGNPAEAFARFGDDGWWPEEASVTADRWSLPAGKLKLGAWYATLDGGMRVAWNGGNFGLDAAFSAVPSAEEAPPVAMNAKLSGDLTRVRIDALRLQAPWAEATLSAPVEFDRQGRLLGGPSQFQLRADLSAQPWIAAQGKVEGRAEITGSISVRSRVSFLLTGQQLAWREFTAATAIAKGELVWPALALESFAFDFGSDGRIEGGGGVDFRRREFAASTLRGRIAGSRLARWLPPKLGFASAEGEVRISGPWSAPAHEGMVRAAGAAWAPLRPADSVAIRWRAEGPIFSRADADATWGETRVVAAGAIGRDAVRLDSAQLTRGGASRWSLESPATLTWRPALALTPVRLGGPSGSVTARIGADEGEIEAVLADPLVDWPADILSAVPPAAFRVRRLRLSGSWHGDEPARISVEAAAERTVRGGQVVALSLAARTEGDGVAVERLEFSDGTRAFARARGRLPVSIWPARPERWRIEPAAAIDFEAVTEPYREFWDALAAAAGARVVNPAGRLTVRGTLEKPEGLLDLRAEAASLGETKAGAVRPSVENLQVRAIAAEDGIRLEEFTFTVDGQRAKATGRLPLDAGSWQRLAREPAAFDWKRADLRLQIEEARLAPFARYLPRFLAPQGNLKVDLALRPGGELAGRLEIAGAATRPLGSLGAVQDVSAEIEFRGWRADFRRVSAQIGGEPLALEGWVELPPDGEPRVNATLRGRNIPVARQPGLVVRSDLDLKVATPEKGPTRVSGTLQLRDSVYVADLRSFVPGDRPAGPARPPPYFSIDVEPLDAWELDVRLAGSRFLRVRTPLFRGMVSAGFRLSGTFANPLAIGEARIDEGTVLFPFAGFAVDHGRVSLTPDRPRQPQLSVTGTTLRYGYDLRMELTGTAQSPNVVFTSRPMLTSEQVLLLVMAGEVPARTGTVVAGSSAQQRFAQIGAYLGRNLFTTFGGDPEAGDRLTVTTGARISRQGQETLEVEYELGRRWSLVGEYDEYDDYNVGLKYKVLRGKKDAEKNAADEGK